MVNEDGKEFVYPKKDCYFVVDKKSEKTYFELKNVLSGNYTRIMFGVGLDEEMNEKGKGNINNLGDLLLVSAICTLTHLKSKLVKFFTEMT